MNKTILTDEESKRLIVLGVPAGEGTFFSHPEGEYWQGDECGDIYFTLEDLLRILPKKITDRQRIYELKIWIDHYSDNWCIEHTHDTDVNDFEDSFVSAEDLCDAVYQEICFLKTEKIKEL